MFICVKTHMKFDFYFVMKSNIIISCLYTAEQHIGTYDCLQFKVLIEPCNAFQVRQIHYLFIIEILVN